MASDHEDEEMRDAGMTETPGESEALEIGDDALDRIRMVSDTIQVFAATKCR